MLDLLPSAIARLLDLSFSLWPSYGAAIVLATGAVLAALTPVALNGMRRQQAGAARLRDLQPELDRIRASHPDDTATRNREVSDFLAANDVTPLSSLGGCLQLALQSPVFMAMFAAIRGLGRVTDGVADPRYLPAISGLRDAVVADNGRLLSLGLDLSASPAAAIAGGASSAAPALVLLGLLVAVGLANASGNRNPESGTNPAIWIVALLAPAFALVMPAGVAMYSLVAATWRLSLQRLAAATTAA